MSDPLVVPSLAALPTQLLGGAPAWYWRYASVATVSFLLAVSGDYYMGSPVTGWIRAWGAQKVKAAEARPFGVLSEATEKRISDLEMQSFQLLTDVHATGKRLEQLQGEVKALGAVVEYTTGRVRTLESYLGDGDKPKRGKAAPPAPVAKVPAQPAPDAGPIAHLP